MYGVVRSNILARDPLPTLNKTYLTLIQEEQVKIIARAMPPIRNYLISGSLMIGDVTFILKRTRRLRTT